jgi:hypothetical protein
MLQFHKKTAFTLAQHHENGHQLNKNFVVLILKKNISKFERKLKENIFKALSEELE